MAAYTEQYLKIKHELDEKGITLVAVSKTKPVEDILELYQLGHRDFGENYVQELVDKQEQLPKDIRWHFIGHLQTNKAKYIAPFVHLIHGVDSIKLLKEIDKQGAKAGRTIDVLLQMHIAQEETKFGLDQTELDEAMRLTNEGQFKQVRVLGLMGMASFTEDAAKVRQEFSNLRAAFTKLSNLHSPLSILSMGMSADYPVAIENGSTMVRIGSLLFGERSPH